MRKILSAALVAATLAGALAITSTASAQDWGGPPPPQDQAWGGPGYGAPDGPGGPGPEGWAPPPPHGYGWHHRRDWEWQRYQDMRHQAFCRWHQCW